MMPAGKKQLILASASPRRGRLLASTGLDFRTVTPQLPEPRRRFPGLSPAMFAEALAYFKARAVAGLFTNAIIVASDTVVALGDSIFGKPKDRADAARILSHLAGTHHQVITAIALVDTSPSRRSIAHDTTFVVMKPMASDLLDRYLDSEAWRGKAGAYAVQETGDVHIERIEGSFTNVIGLPMELLARMLVHWGYVDRLRFDPPLPTWPPRETQTS